MHPVQASVLRDIVAYIADKCGKEPVITSLHDGTVEVGITLDLKIGRDYPGMEGSHR